MDPIDKRKKSARKRVVSAARAANRPTKSTRYPVDERGVIDIRGRAKRIAKKSSAKNRSRSQAIKQLLLTILPFFLIAIVLFGLLHFLTRKNAFEVLVGTTSVGFLAKNKDVTAEYLTGLIKAGLESEQGTAVRLLDEVSIKEVHVDKLKMVQETYILMEAKKMISFSIQAGVIYIENKDKIILQSETEANEVLEQIMAVFMINAETVERSGFVENVTVKAEFVEKDQITTKQKALQILQTSTDEVIDYTIGDGDMLSKIASKAGVTINAILETNPGMTRETILRIGDSIQVPTKVPYVSVYIVEKITTEQVIPMPVETIEDDTKPFGYRGTSQEGKDGKKEISIMVTKINGLESERSEPTEVITEQPITQMVVKGTKQ